MAISAQRAIASDERGAAILDLEAERTPHGSQRRNRSRFSPRYRPLGRQGGPIRSRQFMRTKETSVGFRSREPEARAAQ